MKLTPVYVSVLVTEGNLNFIHAYHKKQKFINLLEESYDYLWFFHWFVTLQFLSLLIRKRRRLSMKCKNFILLKQQKTRKTWSRLWTTRYGEHVKIKMYCLLWLIFLCSTNYVWVAIVILTFLFEVVLDCIIHNTKKLSKQQVTVLWCMWDTLFQLQYGFHWNVFLEELVACF